MEWNGRGPSVRPIRRLEPGTEAQTNVPARSRASGRCDVDLHIISRAQHAPSVDGIQLAKRQAGAFIELDVVPVM